ncbi:Uncharacterized protein FWK35_00008802 [Aphis craccivora]|uniref:Uncharacterized protein n=1 Tax=Aphis craccivora TaxID=307492 RepID=A0A6G0ZHA5_APHCR|nr:Uncharacterized protein FWK35_00008802 [Aphis craccivora]
MTRYFLLWFYVYYVNSILNGFYNDVIFFFVSVTTFWSSKSASIFKLSPVSDRKVNLVNTLGVKSKKFPIVFKSVRKNPTKVTEKQEFLRETSFRQNLFFYMAVIQKLMTVTYDLFLLELKKKLKVSTFLRNLLKTRNIAMSIKFFGPIKILEHLISPKFLISYSIFKY